jgi:GT2 family glycosyltransferase
VPDPAISFIIPVRNDAARLRVCLARICERTPPGVAIEIIVADNGSTDASAVVARDAGATVLSLPDLRVGDLRNRAADVAAGAILAFVDADNEIEADWIETALDALRDPEAGAVGAPYHPPSPGTWVQRCYDRLRRHPTRREPTDWVGSGNVAIKRDAFRSVGGFDAALETCEDVDLCRKLRAAGFILLADHRMLNVHHGDPRTLRQVFLGELWRGRDNLRVSLRPPVSTRTLISAILPLVNLAAATVFVIAALAGSLMTAAASVGFLFCVIALRAWTMTGARRLGDWPRAFIVAGTYEAGRALALVSRFGYRRRRREAMA